MLRQRGDASDGFQPLTIPSPQFFLFVAVVALLLLGRPLWWRRAVLLVANGLLLASFAHDLRAITPLGGFIMLGYAAQRFCVPQRRALPAVIVAVILMIAWLKHYSFVPRELFLPFPYAVVGLSYIFFRVLHLVIDRYQNAIEQPIGLVSYLNYVLNFTTLVSGPIQRYQDFQATERRPNPLDLAVAGRALERIVVGTFKVEIISALLSVWRHQAVMSLQSGGDIWSGAVTAGLYPVYLYFNFSGYIDVMIGTALLFGMVLPENFDRPFLAENVLTFWNRWHMTLSGWLKTYVFNPLMLAGMSRVTAPALAPYVSAGAFFVTFFLVGLWHGQTASFIVFGLLTGGGVAANKMWQVTLQRRLGRAAYRALAANAVYRAVGRGLNFAWFAFTLLWFWSNGTEILSMAHELGPKASMAVWVAIFAAATVALSGLQAWRTVMFERDHAPAKAIRSRYVRTAMATALAVVVAANLALLAAPPPDIVYKAF